MTFADTASGLHHKHIRYGYSSALAAASERYSADESTGSACTLPPVMDYAASLPRVPVQPVCIDPAIDALVREGEAIAAMANRICQHFQRYTQLLADLPLGRTHQHSHGSGSDTTQTPSETGHCCDRPQSSAHHSSHVSGAPALFTDSKPASKRPLSDFNFFCRDARKLVVEVHPEYTKEQVNKELGRIWSMLDGRSRQYYRSLYVQDKQRYTQDVANMTHRQGKSSQSQIAHPDGSATLCPTVGASRSALQGENCFNAGDEAKQTIWKCIAAPASSNTIQSILNETLSPEASDRADKSEDMDEPLASVVLRDHAQTLQMSLAGNCWPA
ncbi:High mobility group box 1 [Coemansia sp. RSA 1199]|nr:High mobility group box 1 [Coemansia sp. RSA 1199]